MRNLRALSYKKGLAGAPGRAGIWSLIWLQEGSQWETFPELSIQIFAIKIQLLEEDMVMVALQRIGYFSLIFREFLKSRTENSVPS